MKESPLCSILMQKEVMSLCHMAELQRVFTFMTEAVHFLYGAKWFSFKPSKSIFKCFGLWDH